MGMTITEKILSRVVGKDVQAGDIIYPKPDLTIIHDGYAVALKKDLDELNIKKIKNPEKVMFVTDHEAFPIGLPSAEKAKEILKIVEEYGIKYFYDGVRGGIGHVTPVEDKIVRPGMFIEGYDTHCPNFGAVGALAFPILGEVASVLSIGSTWIKVPETIKINLHGKLEKGVTIRDLAQYIITQVDADDANYSMFEFAGEALKDITIDGRMTLCNTPLEIGAKSIIFPTDEVTKEYYSEEIEDLYSDLDAKYKIEYSFDLSEIQPQIGMPPTPDNAVDIESLIGKKINHGFIGSCASGMIEDLRQAAAVLKGRKVHPSVRLYIVPATQKILAQANKEGLLGIFIDSDCTILPPGCGPCAGGKIATLASGDVSISTATRNDPGRMGARDAEIYLASPVTVAASAIEGKIVKAEKYL